jgi:hypothetical protein
MRALNAAGAVLHEARLTVRDLDVPTSDYARLLTLRAALERLYSKNIDGWPSRGWKRNTDLVKEFPRDVQRVEGKVKRVFPEREKPGFPRVRRHHKQ